MIDVTFELVNIHVVENSISRWPSLHLQVQSDICKPKIACNINRGASTFVSLANHHHCISL